MASLSVRSGGGGDRNTMGRAFFVVWEPAGPEQGKVVVEVCISGRGANPGSPTTGACMRRVGRNRRRSRSACTTCIYSRRWRRGRGAACPGWRRRPSDGRPSPGRCRSGTARRETRTGHGIGSHNGPQPQNAVSARCSAGGTGTTGGTATRLQKNDGRCERHGEELAV